jgi:hypothetical protein
MSDRESTDKPDNRVLAAKVREKANHLTDQERAKLRKKAMSAIYGAHADRQTAPHRG